MVKTILVVDDEPSVRYTVKHGLEGLDKEYAVVSVSSGDECFEFLEQHDLPDLILLDLMMPEMNGWEVQRRLKEHWAWRSVPVVFLTAIEDRTSKTIGSITSEDYIEKPFTIPRLKERIDRILRK